MTTPDLGDPDRKLSAAESVRVELQREISEGLLVPGDPLDEEAIAARFGISRTPVREALLHLSVRGLVTIAPRAGIYVARLSIPELLGLLELLAELEAVCAKFAARRHSAEEAQALKRVHENSLAFEKQADAAGYAAANAEFHEILYRACRNEPLAREIAHLRMRTQVYRQSVFQNQLRIRRSREDHERVVRAILMGDPDGAYAAMLDHIAIGGRDFADLLSRVPTTMLAGEPEYPGRSRIEPQRAVARKVLAEGGPKSRRAKAVKRR
ncbi:GntR family transcriptional regulator [Ramlibacter sp.]|uniref:GntR family transcriptional regulator n=1 Tax=Ramlibacter sp. TaxID=1917967 RepID=UPI003D1264F4